MQGKKRELYLVLFEYLNDETMQLIEDVRSGKEKMYKVDSFEEYLEMVKKL